MRLFLKIIIGIIVGYFLVLLAFAYEENYREFIRDLYTLLSEDKITFKNHGKYLHFTSSKFIFCLLIFSISMFALLKKQGKEHRVRNIFFGIVLLIISTLTVCYIDSNAKLTECTTCDNRKRVLTFNDINYDMIFITSLVFAILPIIMTEIKNWFRPKPNN